MSARRAARRRAEKALRKSMKGNRTRFHPEPLHGALRTYWNGMPTAARRVRVRVGTSMLPTWWCAELKGTERRAVEVTYGSDRFLLDDETGQGWAKVTLGRGSPEYGHRSLPDDSEILEELHD